MVPETLGQVVTVSKVNQDSKGLRLGARLPAKPGLYRLVVTLHDADGIAYDAATQALLPGLLVRVTSPTSAAVLVADTAIVGAGEGLDIDATVVNTGQTSWAVPELADPRRPDGPLESVAAALVGRLVPLGDASTAPDASGEVGQLALGFGIEPGGQASGTLELTAPTIPGSYLLILDVVVPGTGSLIAAGNPPTYMTILVGEATGEPRD